MKPKLQTAGRTIALLLLMTCAAAYGARWVTPSINNDIWLHLRTGQWIVQNHAFPRDGLFSQYSGRAWVDCAWGFDVVVFAAYRLLGLRGLPVLSIVFKAAFAAATFFLARGLRANFWAAVLLSAAAQYVIIDLPLLPVTCSILFFAVELFLLLQSRRRNDARPLFWLPLLFFLWANVHEQFLNGLLLLGLFVTADVVESLLRFYGVKSFPVPTSYLGKISAVAGLSLAATLLTPYGFDLFASAYRVAYSKVLLENFGEMQALSFRTPQNFVLLLLVMGAILALGRRRSRDLFQLIALSLFSMLAFRVQRDVRCAVLVAIAVIAECWTGGQQATEPRRSDEAWKWQRQGQRPLAALLVLGGILVAIVRVPNNDEIINQVGRLFPVKACEFIQTRQLPAPLFNAYNWGGFLTWYLPEYPVVIDGRLDLYGSERTRRHLKVTEGSQRLETDPDFVRARTILLESNSGMVKALTTLPGLREQFHVGYQDDVAAVLVRE